MSARERLRALSADTARDAVQEYERLAKTSKLDTAQRYGKAIAHLRANEPAPAIDLLQGLLAQQPRDQWLELALAEAEAKAGRHADADARFESLVQRSPNDRAIALTYARALGERNTVAAGKRAQALLRPLLPRSAEDPVFQKTFARASEIAGDPVRAGEAYAEAAYLAGRPEQALVQLNTLKKRPELDYYARARIESRIAAITPVVLELRRMGVRDEDLGRR